MRWAQLISSSILFDSGSTLFGNTADDTHTFTGSVRVSNGITGSLLSTNGVLSGSIQIANDTPYGLTNYIQTQDKEKVKRVARKLRSGMVDVNGAGIAVDAPFGGYKHSGIGREAGAEGLTEFLEVKSVGGWN